MLRTHAAIYNIIQLIPKATSLLPPIFVKNFPYKLSKQEVISGYVAQLLIVLDYAPSLFGDVYELCIRHALQIDVEIRIHVGGDVSIEQNTEDEDDHAMFDMDEADGKEKKRHEVKANGNGMEADDMADKVRWLFNLCKCQ